MPRFVSLAFVLLAGCPAPPADPIVPPDYATWTEVRNCRRSPDHDLAYIRVLASPSAEPVYTSRTGSFPVGAVLVKEEYADIDCTDLIGLTAMERIEGDWLWQSLSADRVVDATDNPGRCAACHEGCGVPPDGYEGTCTAP